MMIYEIWHGIAHNTYHGFPDSWIVTNRISYDDCFPMYIFSDSCTLTDWISQVCDDSLQRRKQHIPGKIAFPNWWNRLSSSCFFFFKNKKLYWCQIPDQGLSTDQYKTVMRVVEMAILSTDLARYLLYKYKRQQSCRNVN